MENKKVIIMSIDGKETVGYTNDGEFINAPKQKHHQVGQIVDIGEFRPEGRRSFAGWQVATAAAAIFLVAFMGIFYPQFNQEAEAYLSVGLNSGGIEMWVDDKNEVTDVKYHDSAEKWDEINIQGKDVYQAVTIIATEAKKSGLIDEQQQNLMMLNHSHHLDDEKLKQSVYQGLGKNHHCLIVMGNHDMSFVNKAQALGVTASQYYVIEKSNAKGHHLTTDQIKNHHIRDVLNATGTTPEEIFGMGMGMGSHMNETGSGMQQPKHDTNNTNNSPLVHPNHMKHKQETMGGHH
ncbi:anti-sigma factor domain-containing protein [Peptococcaceae bacterium 1198_IL3148]